MHVVLLSPAWPPESNSNGIVTYVRWMRDGLVRLGCRVSILAFVVDEDCRDSEVHRIEPMPAAQRTFARLMSHLGGRRPSVYDGGAQIAAAVARLHRTLSLDVVEMEESFGWAAAVQRSTGITTLVKLHGPAFLHLVDEELNTAFGQEKVRREGVALATLPFIFSPSRGHLEDTLTYYGLRPAIAEHLVNPLGLSSATPLWDATHSERNTILFVGRFDKVKGADVLVEAFHLLLADRPELRLVFVGPDSGLVRTDGTHVRIAEFIQSFGDSRLAEGISIRGRLAPEEIAILRARAACVVVPSRRESQGYTALEAMLQGCPVVCTDASGLTELIDHGVNGLKARVADPGDLATQIARLLDDSTLSARLGVEARRYVLEHHDPQRVAAKAIAIYKRAIELSKPRNGVRSSASSAGMT